MVIGDTLALALPREADAREAAQDRNRRLVLAISALDVQFCCLGGHDGSANDNARNAY